MEKKIYFETNRMPALKSGQYKISVRPNLKLGDKALTPKPVPAVRVEVQSPRYYLPPGTVRAVFPPRDSYGEFDNVLPHVELSRLTLPWERSDSDSVPWLALVLLQDDEVNDPKLVQVEQLEWNELRDAIGLSPETGDTNDPSGKKEEQPPQAKCLNLAVNFARQILPSKENLALLAHLRHSGDNQHEQGEDRAIIVGNRLPRRGSHATVHLVSLEGYYGSDREQKVKNAAQEMVSFPSLASWSFICPNIKEYKVRDGVVAKMEDSLGQQVSEAFPPGLERDTLYRGEERFTAALKTKGITDKEYLTELLETCLLPPQTFKGLMNDLDIGWFRARMESDDHFFTAGSIPVRHDMRTGSKTVSWYRGPFIASKSWGTNLSFDLPVHNSDQLLLYDEDTQMLDASYAAAWQLGRMLTIEDKQICQLVARWKMEHAHESALMEQQLYFLNVAFTDPKFMHSEAVAVAQQIDTYFEELKLLKGIPFQYLVPNEKLLPDESLRFFIIDKHWVSALLDGAFSIGRVTGGDVSRDKNYEPPVQQQPAMGCLLRSDLVAGWPSLKLKGFKPADEEEKEEIQPLRYEIMGKDILLVIFPEEVDRITISLPVQSLHFGFSRKEDGTYFKELKSLKTGKEVLNKDEPYTQEVRWGSTYEASEALRIFSPKAFISAMYEENTDTGSAQISSGIEAPDKQTDFQSSHLAIELIEGVPSLDIDLKRPE